MSSLNDILNLETEYEFDNPEFEKTLKPMNKTTISELLKTFKIDDDVTLSLYIDEDNNLKLFLNNERMNKEEITNIFKTLEDGLTSENH